MPQWIIWSAVLGGCLIAAALFLVTRSSAVKQGRAIALIGCLLLLPIIALHVSDKIERMTQPRPPALNLPESTPPEVAARIKAMWPAIVDRCPGLKKYWPSLEFRGVETFPECSAALAFKVTEEPGHFPAQYRSWGHNCWLCIADDGSTVTIWKSACQELFLDQPIADVTKGPLVLRFR